MSLLNIFKGKKEHFSASQLGTDIHSHLIPGIDDGAKTMEDSIQLIKGLMELGYDEIITTPHIHREYYPNDKNIILSGLEDVKQALHDHEIQIEIHASAEYFMDEFFEELIDSDELIPIHGKYILVEQSFFAETPNVDEILFRLQAKGYQPILAHPERYTFWADNFERYQRLSEQGILLQVNILSLTGQYGKIVQQTGKKLIDAGLADLLGTDLHHEGHIEKLKKVFEDRKMRNLMRINWKNKSLSNTDKHE